MVGLFVSFSSTFFPVWFVLFLFFFAYLYVHILEVLFYINVKGRYF